MSISLRDNWAWPALTELAASRGMRCVAINGKIEAELAAAGLAQRIGVALPVGRAQEPPQELRIEPGRLHLEDLCPKVGQAKVDRHRQLMLALIHPPNGRTGVGRTGPRPLGLSGTRSTRASPTPQTA